MRGGQCLAPVATVNHYANSRKDGQWVQIGGSSEDKLISPMRIGQGEIHPLKAALWGSNPYLYYTSWITAMQFILELASPSSNVSKLVKL